MSFISRRSSAVVVAVAAIGCAAAPVAVAALTAPVIHESFTLLPCPKSPKSTLQLEGCAEQKIVAGDKRIDALNAKLFSQLHGTRAKRDFIAGHNAWLAYRHKYCTSVSDLNEGGSLAPLGYAQCVVELNTDHVRELTSFLSGVIGA